MSFNLRRAEDTTPDTPSEMPGIISATAINKLSMIFARAVDESWTPADVKAACRQVSLLSYQSSIDAAGKYGAGTCSDPEDFAHNCPWNDWTPPSKSRLRFLEAAAARSSETVSERRSRRVRVHITASENVNSPAVIAFVTREVNNEGTLVLIFRRGAEILGYPLILQKITMLSDPADRRIITLRVATPDGCMPPIYLRFEDDKRRLSFEAFLEQEHSSHSPAPPSVCEACTSSSFSS